jgi:hypothetical protein
MTAGSPSATEIAAATERALAGLQTELDPVTPEVGAAPTPLAVDTSPVAAFLDVLVWVLVAAGVVVLVTMAVQSLARRRTGEAADEAPEEPGPRAEAAVRPPEAATRAAARGDFGEALRLLLGEVLPRFYRGRGDGWPEAWTSRQCLRHVPRAEPARADLADLVATVERHHFGGRPATAVDWERWRERAPAPGHANEGGGR